MVEITFHYWNHNFNHLSKLKNMIIVQDYKSKSEIAIKIITKSSHFLIKISVENGNEYPYVTLCKSLSF